MNPERWGIFGGVFDPVHYAHLAIAEQVARRARSGPRRVRAGARAGPPAAGRGSAEDRVAMLELAIAGNGRFELEPHRDRRRGAGLQRSTPFGPGRRAAVEQLRLHRCRPSRPPSCHEWHEPEPLHRTGRDRGRAAPAATPTCRASGSSRTFPDASIASCSSRPRASAIPRPTSAPASPRAARSATSFRLRWRTTSANMGCIEPMTDQRA